ncbi:MAG: LytR/AlgR family response regulator transcription factor [Bacillota bacterium]
MIRVLVVDDEPLARDELRYLLGSHPEIAVVGEAEDSASALAAVRQLRPDVVFMDIDLQGDNGLEVARQFLTLPAPPRVVFATAYDQFALRAFEVKALDYLVKPFTAERVAETVERLRELGPAAPLPVPASPKIPPTRPGPRVGRITVEEDERILLLDPEGIYFATREERVTLVKAEGRTYRTHLSLQELEERLQEYPFFRTHRAFLVHLGRVSEIHPWFNGAYELVMSDRERSRIPVSRQAARRLRELLQF